MGVSPDENCRKYYTGAVSNGLVEDYSHSVATALELIQSCTKPSIYQLCEMTETNFKIRDQCVKSTDIQFENAVQWLEYMTGKRLVIPMICCNIGDSSEFSVHFNSYNKKLNILYFFLKQAK